MEKRLTIRLPEYIFEEIRLHAAMAGSGMAEWARDVLRSQVCDHPNAYEGVCGDCGHVSPDSDVAAVAQINMTGLGPLMAQLGE